MSLTLTTTLLSLLLCRLPADVEVADPGLHRAVAVASVAVLSRSLREARDLGRLAYAESRWNPRAVSSAGACGTWGQIPRYSRIPTSCARLATQPVHAVLVALDTTRVMRRLCGRDFLRCYTHGPYSGRRR